MGPDAWGKFLEFPAPAIHSAARGSGKRALGFGDGQQGQADPVAISGLALVLDELLLNAQNGINILSDGNLIRSPNSGYHMNVFYIRTLDGFKFILVGCMTSYCMAWFRALDGMPTPAP